MKRWIYFGLMSALLAGCHKSSLGLRGMAGLGESMTAGNSDQSQRTSLVPRRVLDAHVQLEAAADRFALQPSPGLEVSFQGSNVVGGAILASNMDFYPNWEHPSKFDLVYCARGAEVVSLPKVEKGIQEGKYHCLLLDARGVEEAADSPKLAPWYRLAKRYGLAVVFHHPFLMGGLPGRYWKADAIFRVATEHRDLNFVIAQPGMASPESLLPQLEKAGNVYVVTTTLLNKSIEKMSQRKFEIQFRELVSKFGAYPEYILFGSGWPHSRISPMAEMLGEAVSPDQAEAVFFKNAQRVFNIRPHRGVAAAAAAAAAEAAVSK